MMLSVMLQILVCGLLFADLKLGKKKEGLALDRQLAVSFLQNICNEFYFKRAFPKRHTLTICRNDGKVETQKTIHK